MQLKSIYFVTQSCGGGKCLAKFVGPFHFIRFSNSEGGHRIKGGWRRTPVSFGGMDGIGNRTIESLTVAEAQARYPKAFPSSDPSSDRLTASQIGVDTIDAPRGATRRPTKKIHDVDMYTGFARCGETPKLGKRIWIARRLEDVNCPACLADLRSPSLTLEDVHQ